MMRLSAAHVSALCEGADPSTIPTLNASKRNLQQVVGLDVCTTLTRLDLSDNRLSSIEGLALCTNLRWLSVSGNLLKSLKGVEGFTQLAVLNGSRNELTSATEVTGLSQLRALILNSGISDNLITTIDRLDHLRNLNTLVVSNNPIRELGNFANMLSSLCKLSMSHCQIQVLGTSLRKCVALRELRLAHNNLSVLPKELERNGRLRILDVGNNDLHNWTDLQVLSTISSLKILNLKGNALCSGNLYSHKVLQLVPGLQILDGRPVEAYSIEGKSTFSPVNLNERKEVNETAPEEKKLKRRKKKHVSADAGVNEPMEDEERPFIHLINEQLKMQASSSAGDKDLASEAALIPQRSSHKECAGGYNDVGHTLRREIFGRFGGFEIGLGGSSTWDTVGNPLKLSESAYLQRSSRPAYTRWDLKSEGQV